MDFLNNAVNKTKEAIDIACKKTGEIVNTSKQKLDIASLENKRAKNFQQLGELYFKMIKDNTVENAEINALVKEIKNKNEKIKRLKEEIGASKNRCVCPGCGALVEENSIYCNICGEKIENE